MEKNKKFSTKVMEYPIPLYVSKGMYLAIKKQGNMSNYLRTLVCNDLKIDMFGNKDTK